MSDPAPAKKGVWMRRLLWIGAAVALLAVTVFAFRNFIARRIVEEAVTRVTGFPLEIGSVELDISDSRVEIRDLLLLNPDGFEDARCLHVPRLMADVELGSASTDEFHAEEIILDVAEVVVVRNAKGETNLERMLALKDDTMDTVTRGGEKELRWKCDVLRLSIGKVILLDYTQAKNGRPKKDVYDLGIEKEFRNITEPGQITRILVLEVITGSPIQLVGVTVDKLRDGLGGVVDGAGSLLKGTGKAVIGVFEGAGEAIGDLFGGGKDPKPPPKEKKPPK